MDNHLYELMFIVHTGDDDEASRGKVLDEIQAEIKKQKGKIVAVQELGKKMFAYQLKNKKDGYYYLINFESNPQSIQKLREKMKINVQIVRELMLRVDEFSEPVVVTTSSPSVEPSVVEAVVEPEVKQAAESEE